jgi:ComF family protein
MRGEDFLCTSCLLNLPRTNYHLLPDNPVERLFWGKIPLVRASSYFFYYRGSESRRIIHQLKYGGKKEIGRILGHNMAAELLSSGFFDDIDLLLPIALHSERQHDRGYNQSEWIAKGIAEVTNIAIETKAVKRIKQVETQTHKTPFERWENVQQIFHLEHPQVLENKHVLVVDDVITTGATASAFMESFVAVEGVRISLLTLGVAAQ